MDLYTEVVKSAAVKIKKKISSGMHPEEKSGSVRCFFFFSFFWRRQPRCVKSCGLASPSFTDLKADESS